MTLKRLYFKKYLSYRNKTSSTLNNACPVFFLIFKKYIWWPPPATLMASARNTTYSTISPVMDFIVISVPIHSYSLVIGIGCGGFRHSVIICILMNKKIDWINKFSEPITILYTPCAIITKSRIVLSDRDYDLIKNQL